MRIFLGVVEVCNIINTYTRAFRSLGHDTLTGIYLRNKYYSDSEYDEVFCRSGKSDLASYPRWAGLCIKAVSTCDLFIFAYSSLTPNFIDLPLLRRLGKQIVFVFWGSEARSIDAFEQQMRSMGVVNEYLPFIEGMRARGERPLAYKLRRIQAAERYSDLILSQPGYAQLQTRPYMRANVPLDLSKYKCDIPGREVPLVVHAPSNPLTKGTPRMLEAIERLRGEGVRFDVRFIENMQNAELRELLASADIILDELYADTVGVLSSEGMATGNAVLTHYPANFAKVPGNCPAINITSQTLEDNLRRAILDRQWRCELAVRGREYVELYNDHIQIARKILNMIQPGGVGEYDFIPTFYRQYNQELALLQR